MRIAGLGVLLSIALLSAESDRLMGQTVPEKNTKNVQKLIDVLKSNTGQKEKMDACRQLGVIGSSETVAPLAALLGDEKLSHMARYGLEPIPDPGVDEVFRKALKELTGRLLVGVIGSVGVRRDSMAVPQLALLLKSSDPEVADASARALGAIADERALEALEAALSETPAASRPGVAEGLFRCAQALALRGDQSRAAAIYSKLLAKGASHQVRAGALRGAVLTQGAAGGVPLLAQYLQGDDPVLFLAAVKTAQEVAGKEVCDLLIGELGRSVPDRQIPIMQTLGKRKDAVAAPFLAEIAQKGRPEARVAAVRTLAEIAAPSAVSLLFELLADPQTEISSAAREALSAFPGSHADDILLTLVDNPELKKRVAAIDLIQMRRTKAALPALKKAAGDPDAEVRRPALEAVGKVGEADDLPFLLALFPGLKEPADIAVMESSFADLGIRSPDREGYAADLIGLKGLAAEQQACILRVLGVLGGKNAFDAVLASAKGGTGEVRNAAIRAFASWKTPDAAPGLLAFASATGDPTEKALCLRGYLRLSSHADVSLDERLSMARQAAPLVSDVGEKRMLLSVLQRSASVDSFSLAARYLDDPDVEEEAGLAVTAIAESIVDKKPKSVVPVMEKVAKTTQNKSVLDRVKAVLAKAAR